MKLVFIKGLEVAPNSASVSLKTEGKTGHRRNIAKEHAEELCSQNS